MWVAGKIVWSSSYHGPYLSAVIVNFSQNLLACAVFNTHESNSHTLFQQLHWFHIKCRINFNIADVTFNTLHYSPHPYLHSTHTPARSLRSSNTNLLTVPFARTSLGARSFLLKCSQPSPIMPLHHICKANHFLSTVLFIPSLYYECFIRRIFIYLSYLYCVYSDAAVSSFSTVLVL